MPNKLLKKFASFSFGTWIGLIIGVISTPIITRIFSPEDFAKASMFNLAINILMIFVVFGTDQAYVRFFYEEEADKRKYLLKNTIKFPILLSIVILPIIFIFNHKISLFLFEESYPKLIVFLGLSIIVYVLNRFSVLVVRMEQKGKIFSLLQVCLKLFELFGILFFVYILGNGFESLIYARTTTMTLVGIIAIYYSRKNWSFFNQKVETKHNVKEVFKYGSPLVITTLITWLFQSFDKLAIKEWSDMKELGIYAAAFRIVAILNIIQTTFSTFWTPVAYEAYEKDRENIYFFEKVSRILSIIMLCVATGTIMLKDVIALLLGKSFREASMIMPFLIFMPVMYTISETTVLGINFKKKIKWHMVIATISCITNIIGNYFLVKMYGAKGAAISTGFSYIIFFGLRTYFSLKYYKVNYHIKRLSIILIVLFIYALYNTFYNNFKLSFLSGIFILLFIIIINFKFFKTTIKELKGELK